MRSRIDGVSDFQVILPKPVWGSSPYQFREIRYEKSDCARTNCPTTIIGVRTTPITKKFGHVTGKMAQWTVSFSLRPKSERKSKTKAHMRKSPREGKNVAHYGQINSNRTRILPTWRTFQIQLCAHTYAQFHSISSTIVLIQRGVIRRERNESGELRRSRRLRRAVAALL